MKGDIKRKIYPPRSRLYYTECDFPRILTTLSLRGRLESFMIICFRFPQNSLALDEKIIKRLNRYQIGSNLKNWNFKCKPPGSAKFNKAHTCDITFKRIFFVNIKCWNAIFPIFRFPINILERKFVPWFDFSCLSGPKALSEKLFRPKISQKAKSN
jgi:hypothetical protein